VRKYLQQPEKLFRRVRDKHGVLHLSKNAAAYHPGRGVYRSSYKNAIRLTGTETNIAYRSADHAAYQGLDFVVGIEIKLSGNHPVTDICDTLKGRYPKTFKWTGWHPACRCYQVPILKTEEEFWADMDNILSGGEPTDGSVNAVGGIPANFTAWMGQNAGRINQSFANGTLPFFLRYNSGLLQNSGLVSPNKASGVFMSDPLMVGSFVEMYSLASWKISARVKEKAFNRMLKQEAHTRDGDVIFMQGAKFNETEAQTAKKLTSAGYYVVFPGEGQIKLLKKSKAETGNRMNDVFAFDKKTFFARKIELKTVFGGAKETIKERMISGSGQAPVIVLDIQGGTSRNNLIQGIREGWNINLRSVLVNWKGQWYEIDKDLLFSKGIYEVIK